MGWCEMMGCIRFGCLGVVALAVGLGSAAASVDVDPDRRARMVERYESILLQRPRKGPALRGLYKLHVEALDVDAWLDDVEAQAAAHPEDARRWLLAGLILLEHGNEERARPYLERAAELDPSDWYAPFCLGESELYANRYESAAAHLETAAERTRESENLVAVYTALGRAYLRQQRPEEAQAIWDRVIQLRPDDTQTIEELAELLYEEDHVAAAVRLFEQLHRREDVSPYQRVHYALRLARMKARTDRPDEALALYQEALNRVGPDSWLYEEIYAQIEGLYREEDRLEELIALYRERLRQRPQEVKLARRLADNLALRGDEEAAIRTLEAAVERAPSRVDLREALADQCLRSDRHAEAIAHLERLVREQPDSPSYRLRLARTWRQRTDVPDHRDQALRWVLSLAERGPETAETALRVAEALTELNFREEAVAWYQRAVERAPAVGEYHEYLGEHLLALGRRQEALDAFQALAAGDRRSAPALARLADVLAFHGFEDQALDALAEAVDREPSNFDVGSLYARHLAGDDQVDEALAEWERIEELAPNAYFRDEVVDQRIRLLGRTDRLGGVYQDLVAGLEDDASPEDWILAAKMALGLRKRLEARDWIDRAVVARPQDLRVLEVAERIYRTVGDVEGQLRLLQRMAAVEPQRRIDLLKRMAATYQRMGDLEQAMETARELIEWVPSSPTGYQLMARLQADQGRFDAAFDFMKRAIRAAPGEISLRIELAGMFQSQLMIAEAIETYWQVIDVAGDVSEKLAVIRPLTELYHGQGRFDRLVHRLRRLKRRARDPAAASLALVTAYETVDDLAAARRELTELAAERPADENVLRQLVSLSRREGDLARAVAFQRSLVELAPSRTNCRLLGDLLLETNDRDGALAAWRRGMERPSAAGETEIAQAFEWIEQLERNGFSEQADAALRDLYRRHRDDWRVVYRVAVAHALADDLDAAFPLFLEIVERPAALTVSDEAGGPEAVDPSSTLGRYPWPYLAMQEVGAARHALAGARSGRLGVSYGGAPPADLDRAQALSLAFIAMMEGQEAQVDEWLASLRYGSRAERHLLLKVALILHDTAFTRAVSRDILAAYPDDAFARFVSMTPSRAQAQYGVEDEFLAEVRGHLAWFKERHPGYEWFYDWHELRVLVMHGDQEQIRTVARRLVDRGQSDPFVLAQSMNLLHRAKLYDVFESCIDGALAYYDERGAASVRQQLLNSLGYIAIEMLREDPARAGRALRVFGKYLDAARPDEPRVAGARTAPAAWAASGQIREQLTLPYPQPTYGWSSAEQNLAQRFYNTASQAGRELDVIRFFEQRVDLAEAPARRHAQLGLARIYWWGGRPEDTRSVLREAVEERPDDYALRLELSRLEQELGNLGEALALAGELTAPFGGIHREMQLWLLQLALDAGDEAAARAPAERLLRMRLSPDEMVDLADHLTTLGETAEAQRLMRRAERMQQVAGGYGRGGGLTGAGLEQRLERLRMHERKGNQEQARLLAKQMLRACRTVHPRQAERFRGEALGVLNRLGELDGLIAEAEDQLRTQPASLRWVETLFWYYRADGREQDALALAAERLDQLPGAEEFRVRLARLLFDERDFDASVDQLLAVLEKDPSLFFGADANYWLLNQAFAEAGRSRELVEVFERMDPGELMGPRRLLHPARTQTIAHLVNFARDALHQDAIPPALTLRLCRLTPSLLVTRQARETYLPQIYDLAGLAYEATDQPGEAFRSFLACIAPPAVLAELGLEGVPVVRPESLKNVTWAKAAPDSMLLRCLRAGRKAGRMDELESACRAALVHGEPGTRFLLFASVLLQGRVAEALADAEAAIEDGARVGGRPHRNWSALVHQVTVAQLLQEMDAPREAIAWWEAALASPALGRSAGMEESVVQYFVAACVAADRADRARDYLLHERTPETDGVAVAIVQDLGAMTRLVSSIEHLYELGYSLDALRLARRVTGLRPTRQTESLIRRADAIVAKIRETRLPELRDTDGLEELIVKLEAEPLSKEAGSAGWESLLWLYQAQGQTNRAAELRAQVRRVGEADPEWRYRLARASEEAQCFDEAVDDYLAVVRMDPGRFVEDREEFRGAAASFRRTGRMDELTGAFRRTDFRGWIGRSSAGGSDAAAALGNLVQLARYAMHRSLDAPELALVLARRLREAVYGRTKYAAQDQRLAETMARAIADMDLPEDERFLEQLDLVAGASLMRALTPDRDPARMRPVWVLDMEWQEREVNGLLTRILDQAQQLGRLPELETAARAAIQAGDVDTHYLACLFGLRRGGEAVDGERVHQALAAASGYRDRPERRAFLLCVLAQELVRAGRPEEAIGVYEKAVLLAQQSSHDATALSASFYLAVTHVACGRPEAAQRVLREPPVARWSSNRPDRIHDQRSAAMLMQARKLRSLGFHAAAWQRATEVQALYAAQPGHRRYSEAEGLLQSILQQDVPRTRGRGEWEGLVAELEERRAQSPEDARVLYQLYRLHRALDRDDDAAEVLRVLAGIHPEDPDVHHLLATLYYEADDAPRALEQLQALMRLDPMRLFAGPTDRDMVVDVCRRTDRVEELAQAVCDTAGPRLLGPVRKPHEVERAVLGLMALARNVQSPPVGRPAEAARILEFLSDRLPGESRFDSLEKRIHQRMVAVYRELGWDDALFRTLVRAAAGSAVARELGLKTRRSVPLDFRLDLEWDGDGKPVSGLSRLIKAARRSGRLDALLSASRSARGGRPLPPHQYLETLTLLAMERPRDVPYSLPELAQMLDMMQRDGGARLALQAQLAEGYRAAGDARTAVYLLRDAQDLARAAGAGAESWHLVFLLAEALRADQRESEAIALVASHDVAADRSAGDAAAASQRLGRVERAVSYLAGIGAVSEALGKTRQETAWARAHAPPGLASAFQALRENVIHQALPRLLQDRPRRFAEEIDRLARTVEKGRDPGAADDLFRLLAAAGDEERLAALEDRIRRRRPADAALLLDMARRAWEVDETERAARLYEDVLYLDPLLPFARNGEYRGVVGALAAAGRLSALVEAVDADIAAALHADEARDAAERREVVQRLVYAARRLLAPDLDAAPEARALAETARQACGDDASWDPYRRAAEACLRQAIGQLPEGEAAYRAYLEWLVTPALAREFDVAPVDAAPMWTADWRWHETTIQSFLESFVDLVEALDRGPAVVAACRGAEDAGDAEAAYLAALAALRCDLHGDGEDPVGAARDVAADSSRPPADQVRLLALLGRELRQAGRLPEAIRCYQDALAAAARIPPEPGATFVQLYLSEAWEAAGDLEQAEAVLTEMPWAEGPGEDSLRQPQADVLLQHHYRIAGRLSALGRSEAAQSALRAVLSIDDGATRDYYHKKARSLLDTP